MIGRSRRGLVAVVLSALLSASMLFLALSMPADAGRGHADLAITLRADRTSAVVGETITLTADINGVFTGEGLQLIISWTGVRIAACNSVSHCTTTTTARDPGPTTYQALLMAGDTVLATSPSITVTWTSRVPSPVPSPILSIILKSSAIVARVGGHIRLDAAASRALASGETIVIASNGKNQTQHYVVSCPAGRTCAKVVWSKVPGRFRFVASVVKGTKLLAISNIITITWA